MIVYSTCCGIFFESCSNNCNICNGIMACVIQIKTVEKNPIFLLKWVTRKFQCIQIRPKKVFLYVKSFQIINFTSKLLNFQTSFLMQYSSVIRKRVLQEKHAPASRKCMLCGRLPRAILKYPRLF